MNSIQQMLIKSGVKNLKTYGYPHVDEANILTDTIYRAFFASMLKDNLGHGFDADISALLEICKEPS